jgi:hypothetical protein
MLIKMPGALQKWPAWPEYTAAKDEADPTGELIQYKKGLVARYGEEAIRKSWLKVCKELELVTDEIAEKGTSAVPEIQYEELFNLSAEKKLGLKDTGCFVVRGVVSEDLASEWFSNLKTYVADNRSNIRGMRNFLPAILGPELKDFPRLAIRNTLRLETLLVPHSTRRSIPSTSTTLATRAQLMVA